MATYDWPNGTATELELTLRRGRQALAAERRAAEREAERIEAEHQAALDAVLQVAVTSLPPELGHWVVLDGSFDGDVEKEEVEVFAAIMLPGMPYINFPLYRNAYGRWASSGRYQVAGMEETNSVWVAVGMAAEKAERLGRIIWQEAQSE